MKNVKLLSYLEQFKIVMGLILVFHIILIQIAKSLIFTVKVFILLLKEV